MVVMVGGKVTVVKEVQPSKAEMPMVFALLLISTVVSEVHPWKAAVPMEIACCMVIFLSALQ